MTINQQVLRHLNGKILYESNAEIAKSVERPEPSVRRVTRELADAGLLNVFESITGHKLYITNAYGKAAITPAVLPKGCGCGAR